MPQSLLLCHLPSLFTQLAAAACRERESPPSQTQPKFAPGACADEQQPGAPQPAWLLVMAESSQPPGAPQQAQSLVAERMVVSASPGALKRGSQHLFELESSGSPTPANPVCTSLLGSAVGQRNVAIADTLSPAAWASQAPDPQQPAAAGHGGTVLADTLAGTGWGSETLASQGLSAATACWGPETPASQGPSAASQATAASAAATQPTTPGGPSPDPTPDPCARWTPAQHRSARRVRNYDRRALASGSVHAAALA